MADEKIVKEQPVETDEMVDEIETAEVETSKEVEVKSDAPTQASPEGKLDPNLSEDKLGAGTEGSSRTGSSKDEPREEAKAEKPKDAHPKPQKKSTAVVDGATPGQIVKVFKKVGLYGECYQVLVRVLEGRDKGNLLRRNVRGPVKENDVLMLKESERDVRAV
jgi:small subunit ribosomal protein S28e